MTPLESVPPPGLLEFTLPLAPVSQQAKSEAKSAFKCAVQAFTKTAQYLLAGDVQLSVEWLVSEQARYETDRSPDVDNILKPLIDSLVGPDGLIIDDNQIQSVSCSWIDWHREEEQIRVELRFLPDEWLQKQGLVFVQFENGLCMPIQTGESPMGKLGLLEAYSNVLAARRDADKSGLPYKWGRILMPKQRVFHRTRIHGFHVYQETELRANLHREF